MRKLKIVFVHNYYQFRGGEDEMADLDTKLLMKNGHDVFLFSKHNNEIKRYSILQKSSLLFRPSFSLESYFNMLKVIDNFKPDIIHINNFFPLISPSVIYAGLRKKIPIVMSLHDFRLICANGLLLRNSKVCEKCFQSPVFGFLYGCYRNSRIQTLPVSFMIFLHSKIKTWERCISVFITPSDFVKSKFAEAGFDANRISVRPNYVEDEFVENFEKNYKDVRKEDYCVFVGRLSDEKGIKILLSAWDILRKEGLKLKLKIAGDGPLREYVRWKAQDNNLVEVLGFLKKEDLVGVVAKAKFMVVPSVWYEVFGRIVIEAYAVGTPVLASEIGALKDIVIDGKTGLIFEPNPEDIVRKIKDLKPELLKFWSQNAREEYYQKYREGLAYKRLISVYEEVLRSNAV